MKKLLILAVFILLTLNVSIQKTYAFPIEYIDYIVDARFEVEFFDADDTDLTFNTTLDNGWYYIELEHLENFYKSNLDAFLENNHYVIRNVSVYEDEENSANYEKIYFELLIREGTATLSSGENTWMNLLGYDDPSEYIYWYYRYFSFFDLTDSGIIITSNIPETTEEVTTEPISSGGVVITEPSSGSYVINYIIIGVIIIGFIMLFSTKKGRKLIGVKK